MNDNQAFIKLLQSLIPESNRDNEALFMASAEKATKTAGDNSGFWGGAVQYNEIGNAVFNRYKNNFICISSIKKSRHPETGKPRFWRAKAHFGRGLAFMLDDLGSGKGSKGQLTVEAVSSVLPPTAVIETSPDNYQVWYVLKEGVADISLFERSLKAFVDKVLVDGGDLTVKDAIRIGRAPFGVNNKTLDDGSLKYGVEEDGEIVPWRVKVSVFSPENRYSLDELTDAFGVTVPPQPAPRAKAHESDLSLNEYMFQYAHWVLSKSKFGEGGNPLNQNPFNRYRIRCPWGDEHSNGDPYGAFFRGPNPNEAYDHDYVFGCAHDSCKQKGRTWAAFVDEIVIKHIDGMFKFKARTLSDDYFDENLASFKAHNVKRGEGKVC